MFLFLPFPIICMGRNFLLFILFLYLSPRHGFIPFIPSFLSETFYGCIISYQFGLARFHFSVISKFLILFFISLFYTPKTILMYFPVFSSLSHPLRRILWWINSLFCLTSILRCSFLLLTFVFAPVFSFINIVGFYS